MKRFVLIGAITAAELIASGCGSYAEVQMKLVEQARKGVAIANDACVVRFDQSGGELNARQFLIAEAGIAVVVVPFERLLQPFGGAR